MRLLLSSALLGLTWFAAVNAVVSIIAGMLARRSGSYSGRGLVTLRLLPAAASSVFVVGVFLPAHWRFEYPDKPESFGIVLGALAALALGLLLRSAWRAARVGWASYRIDTLTRRSPKRLPAGAFEVVGLSGVSLAGILRPRILVGSEALAALTPAELDLAISHEIAHRRSGDNLKRFLIYCAPDLFGGFSAARRLEEQWQADAECQADAHAVSGDATRAVVLAAALVKVARLACGPDIAVRSPAWSAFHVPTLLEMRVRRLVAGPRIPAAARGKLWCASGMLAVAVPAGIWLLDLAYGLHLVTEAMVTSLP